MTDTSTYVHRLDGPDCAHYQYDQGPVNLGITRAVGCFWIAWKATQSVKYVDPTFTWARSEMELRKFLMRFLYHWLSSTTDPTTQADHYLRTVGDFKPGEGAMLDAEEGGISEASCLAWLERVEASTHQPSSVYTGLYVAGGTLWRSQKLRMSKYGPRPMHLAAYTTTEKLIARMKALGVLDLAMHSWQWSSNGPVPGIVGRCDMNAIIDNIVVSQACGVLSTTPIPTPIPEDTTMRFVGSKDNPGPTRWVLDGTRRTLPTFESANYLIAHGLVTNNLTTADLLTDAELAGFPVIG